VFKRKLARWLVPLAAAALGLAMLATPAHATDTSTNPVWAGMQAIACGTCHIRYVQADFTPDSITCDTSTNGVYNVADWVGLGGTGSSDAGLIQTGWSQDCTGAGGGVGTSASLFYEDYPSGSVNISTHFPGWHTSDSFIGEVYYDSSTSVYSVTLDDLTLGKSYTVPTALYCESECDQQHAEAVTEDVNGGVAKGAYLAEWTGYQQFSGATATSFNGTKDWIDTATYWTGNEMGMIYEGNDMATTGDLEDVSNDPDYSNFVTQWLGYGCVNNCP
jgi:hypothetical protein